MWQVHIKHDTRHRKWHKLSVRMHEPLSSVAWQHAQQWAIDNQANPDQVAYALVSDAGERIEHLSNATINRG